MSFSAKGRKCTTSNWGGLSLLASSFREVTIRADEMLSNVASLAGTLTALVALVALVFAWRQTTQAREIHVAETRPYVVPSIVDGVNRDGKDSLYFRLENHGRTSALDIDVAFHTDSRWHHVAHPNFPFVATDGVPLLAPRSAIKFFLGVKTPKAEFVATLEAGIRVTVSFASQVHRKRHADTFSATAKSKYARVLPDTNQMSNIE